MSDKKSQFLTVRLDVKTIGLIDASRANLGEDVYPSRAMWIRGSVLTQIGKRVKIRKIPDISNKQVQIGFGVTEKDYKRIEKEVERRKKEGDVFLTRSQWIKECIYKKLEEYIS